MYELNNFTIAYTLFYNVYADSLKTNEQAATAYSLFAGTAAYRSLREKVRDFDRYETGNYIFLDEYRENKTIFDLYIRTIMSSINAADISLDYIGESCENIKPDTLNDFDIYIALRYMQRKDLINYFKEYKIKNMPLCNEAVTYLEKISEFICAESVVQKNAIVNEDRFWSFLEILSHTTITKKITRNVFERLLLIERVRDVVSHRDTLNRVFIKIIDEKMYENKKICEQVKSMVTLLFRFNIMDNGDSLMSLISNLLYFIDKGSFHYENINIIKRLIKKERRLLLFTCFPYLSDRGQALVKKNYEEWKPQSDSVRDYYQYCKGVLAEVIAANSDIENEIITWIASMIESSKQESNSNIRLVGGLDYLAVLQELINLYLKNKIINVDELKKTASKSYNEMFKWLLDLEAYDYSKFDCLWLTLCSDRLLQTIAENEVTKKSVILAYKEQYGSFPEADKVGEIIVKYFI